MLSFKLGPFVKKIIGEILAGVKLFPRLAKGMVQVEGLRCNDCSKSKGEPLHELYMELWDP